MNNPLPDKHSLGEFLISRGMITQDQLRIAQHAQAQSHAPLGHLLVSLGFLSDPALREALSASLGRASVDLTHFVADPDAVRLIPESLAKRHRMIPLHLDEERSTLTLAIADPDDVVAFDTLRSTLPAHMRVEALLGSESEIAQAIGQAYNFDLSIDGILSEIETGEIDFRSHTQAERYDHPIVRLVDAFMADATRKNASDIHFEPETGFLRVRYRIDGLLRQACVLHKSCWPAMAVRLKVMAGLNIAENRAPQDGRISMTVHGRMLDFRVSSQPTIHGENIVLRILDRQKGILVLDALGLNATQLETLKLMIARPEGIILFTGPTGSGKTTTLYSILQHINSERVNIMTLEDPVEYPMAMIRQTSVSEASKLDFANGIRSMMRQDPDVILVGEIRDSPTAEMAFRAAMTGHQVYSTLHSNSALGAIPRLLDIGVLPDIMAGNIIGVVAQRLIRKLCVHCRRPRAPEARELKLLGCLDQDPPPQQLYDATGCPQCGFTGYRGRVAIMELLRMDAELDDLIASRASRREIHHAAKTRGFYTLADDGAARVLAGTTSLGELARVIDLTDRAFAARA
jgi:type II secretory ATPase GspE/PulE/Tfp pilus assembly ATPase PilB-like protein